MGKIGHGRPESTADVGGLSNALVLEALSRYLPPERLEEALARTERGGSRIRKLPAKAVLWLVIALGLWGDLDMPAIWRQVAGTLRTLWRLPPRDGRINPRVVKVKMSNFQKKRPAHCHPRHPQRSFAESVVMLK